MAPASPAPVLSVWKKSALAFAVALFGTFAFASTAIAAPTNTADPSFSPSSPYNTGANATLTAADGTWSGTGTITYTYQWQVSPNDFGPTITTVGTGSSYTIPVSTPYCGDYIRVAVTATDSTGSTTVASSAAEINCPSSTAPSLDTNPGAYSGAELVGIRRVGEDLTIAWGGSTGDWTFPGGGSNSLTRTWERNCGSGWVSMGVATSATSYTLTTSDIDCDIRVVLTASTTYTGPYTYTTTATTNLRGVIQRQYGNTYYVRAGITPSNGTSNSGAAPDGHNDCLGASSDVNAPNAAGGTSNSGFEACAQPSQAVDQEDEATNPNDETKIDIGPGTFDGAYIDNSEDSDDDERMLVQGAGRNLTTLTEDGCGGGEAVLEINEDTEGDAFPRAVTVTVKNMTIDGGDDDCDGIHFVDSSGEVQNVRFVDLASTGVEAYTDRNSVDYCVYPERVRVYQSSFVDGSFSQGVEFENDFGGEPGPFETGCTQVKGIVDDSDFDGDGGGLGVVSAGPVSPTVTDSSFTDLEGGVFNVFFTKQAEVADNSFSCVTQGVGSFIQDPPDYQPPVLIDGEYAVPGQKGELTVSDNQFGCNEGGLINGLALNLFSGQAKVLSNTIFGYGLGVAVGPVAAPFGPLSVPDASSPVAALLRGNSITGNFGAVISTNNGYAENTDLELVGNRIAGNLYGLTNYYDNDFDAYDQGAWPPAANLQTSPVEARNNWWGCNNGPTVNPSEATLDALESPDQFCGGDPALPLAGDIIIDGGLEEEGIGSADPAETNVTSDPYLVMGCGASPRTIQRADNGGPGGTSLVTADLARNSDGIQRNVSFPPSEVTFGGNTLGTTYQATAAETDQATYAAQASLKAGAKLGNVTPTATLDYQQLDCGSVEVRNGPDKALLPEVSKADTTGRQNNIARVPRSRRTVLVAVKCPARNIGNCEIKSLTATSKAPGTRNLVTEMILPNPFIPPGVTVQLSGIIPQAIYRRLERGYSGAKSRIKIKAEGSAGIIDEVRIRDLVLR